MKKPTFRAANMTKATLITFYSQVLRENTFQSSQPNNNLLFLLTEMNLFLDLQSK